jgi:DNA-binding NtrC family response regulator
MGANMHADAGRRQAPNGSTAESDTWSEPRGHETILVADDEPGIRELLRDALAEEGYRVCTAATGDEAFRMLEASDKLDDGADGKLDLVLLDVHMPNMDGLEILKARAGAAGDTAIVMLTAFGHSDKVVRAIQFGASDYVCKPFELDDLIERVGRVLHERWQSRHSDPYDLGPLRPYPSTHIIGTSRPMLEVFRMIALAARTTSPVLVTGENGTGKELVAATIHWASPRSRQAYVVLNCAAVPETLMESELFGFYKGKFTGGDRDHMGVFEQANGGTLFLDEIGEMSPRMQAKVLRVLQDGVIRRVGAEKGQETRVDVRLVAATNRDLNVERALQHFRDDLFHRLHVVPIHLPALRDRRGDIPALVAHFLEKHKARAGRTAVDIAKSALAMLQEYDWPGNVRELENVIIAALIRSGGGRITPSHIVLTDEGAAPALIDVRARVLRRTPLAEMERELRAMAYQVALEAEQGDAKRAAARLGADAAAFADVQPARV